MTGLVARCDALRTVFDEVDGIPMQHVLPDMPAGVEYLDWSDDPAAASRVEPWAQQRCQNLFDLSTRLFDCVLIKLAPDQYAWYFCHHHLITDGWSYMLILRQVSDLYERSVRGELEGSPPCRHSRTTSRGSASTARVPASPRTRSTGSASSPSPSTTLPSMAEPTHKRGSRVRRISVSLGDERSLRIKEMLTRLDTSLPMLFAAVVFVFLRRIGGSSAVSIGVPFHNRRSRDLRNVVGLLMEAVLLRVHTQADETFVSLLEKAKAEMFATVRHGSYAIGNPATSPCLRYLPELPRHLG